MSHVLNIHLKSFHSFLRDVSPRKNCSQKKKRKRKQSNLLPKVWKMFFLYWCRRLMYVQNLFLANIQSKWWHQHGRVKVSQGSLKRWHSSFGLIIHVSLGRCNTSNARYLWEKPGEAECLSCGIRDKRMHFDGRFYWRKRENTRQSHA